MGSSRAHTRPLPTPRLIRGGCLLCTVRWWLTHAHTPPAPQQVDGLATSVRETADEVRAKSASAVENARDAAQNLTSTTRDAAHRANRVLEKNVTSKERCRWAVPCSVLHDQWIRNGLQAPLRPRAPVLRLP